MPVSGVLGGGAAFSVSIDKSRAWGPRFSLGQLPPSQQKMGRTGECAPPSRRANGAHTQYPNRLCPTSHEKGHKVGQIALVFFPSALYQRHGASNLFLALDPLRGWGKVRVTENCTAYDLTEFPRRLVEKDTPANECLPRRPRPSC